MKTKLVIDNEHFKSLIINLNDKNEDEDTSQFFNTYFQYYPKIELDYNEDDTHQKYMGEAIIFNNSFINFKNIVAINNFLNSLNCKTLYEGIKKAIDFFSLKNNYSNKIIKGFYGEFLFILKMYEKGINITKNFHTRLFDKNDFYFKDGSLEIKTTSLMSDIYTVSYFQFENMTNLIGMIGIKIIEISNDSNFSDSKKFNLLDLIDKIQKTMSIESKTLINLFQQINADSIYNPLIKELYFKFDDSDKNFKIYKRENIPILESKFQDRIMNVKYQINMIDIETITLNELITVIS